MRITILTVAVAMSVLAAPRAHAIGCLSGGAAGALAGHMAGHGMLGAIGGCIAGHQWRKHQLREEEMMTRQHYEAARRAQNPGYRGPWTY